MTESNRTRLEPRYILPAIVRGTAILAAYVVWVFSVFVYQEVLNVPNFTTEVLLVAGAVATGLLGIRFVRDEEVDRPLAVYVGVIIGMALGVGLVLLDPRTTVHHSGGLAI